MKIAVLGTGTVGQALAGRLAELGHDVTVGTRDPAATAAKEEYAAWASSHQAVDLATFAEAAAEAARTSHAARATWTVPKTPWGDPDLRGSWLSLSYTPLERPAELAGKAFYTEQEAIAAFKQAVEANKPVEREVTDDERR